MWYINSGSEPPVCTNFYWAKKLLLPRKIKHWIIFSEKSLEMKCQMSSFKNFFSVERFLVTALYLIAFQIYHISYTCVILMAHGRESK
jgi:hypothetical protein